jgi:hypothetical protein
LRARILSKHKARRLGDVLLELALLLLSKLPVTHPYDDDTAETEIPPDQS